jgi:hypothetical protein
MDINQNINFQKTANDISQFVLKNQLPDKGVNTSNETDKETFSPLGSTNVSLSEEGRSASFNVAFNETSENLSKLNELKDSDSFAKLHSSISYEKVKNLLD